MRECLLFIFILSFVTGCMSQDRISDLESKRDIQVLNRGFDGDYRFGDCFLYRENGKEYLLVVSSADQNGAVEFIPVAIPSPEDISDFSIGKLTVNYYSKEPNFIDKLLGGEMPSGSFGFGVLAEEILKIQGELEYLFSLNLDPDKFEAYGGTSLLADKTLGYTIEFCLDFEKMSQNAPDKVILRKLPLENLCR